MILQQLIPKPSAWQSYTHRVSRTKWSYQRAKWGDTGQRFTFAQRSALFLSESLSSHSDPSNPNSNSNMTPTTQQHKVLSDILSTNAQWAKDVELAEPGFFFNSTKGQSPKVPFFFSGFFMVKSHPNKHRFYGLAVPILEFQNRS